MPEPSLREFQQWMKSRILPGGTAQEDDRLLNPQRGTPGSARMRVYAGGYLARMQEALAEVFESVHQVLGEGVFIEMAEAYAKQCPSHDYNLSFAGRHLPLFLKTWPRTEVLPFLPDLARLEWLICQAFHAYEQPAIDPQKFSAISPDSWEKIKLLFQPSVGLVASPWPIISIWQARKQPKESINIPLKDHAQQALIYRHQVQVMCEPVDPLPFQILAGLSQGDTLGVACARLDEQANENLPIAEWFSYWMRLGLIASFQVGI